MERIGMMGSAQGFLARVEERKRWEAEHPELSAAWNEAAAEDERITQERKLAKEREERRKYLLETAPDRLVRMGAPRRAVDSWTAELKDTPAVLAVRRMMSERKSFCLLTGGAGAGKTVAAVLAMAERVLAGRREDLPALFVRAVEGARMGLYDAKDKELAMQMQTAGVLVIDDLGAEFVSDGSIWRSVLDEVIDVRYGDRAPTVLTTNLDAAAFKARYGERISDRIRHAGIVESCGATSLRVKGEG